MWPRKTAKEAGSATVVQTPTKTETPSSHPPSSAALNLTSSSAAARDPVPVVKVYSVRGVEYGMLTISLWVTATTLAWVVLNLINNSANFDFLVVPVSGLITSLPVFFLLFLRLRRSELINPGLRFESSKRRWTQVTQFLAFIVCLINVGYFVYSVLQHFANDAKNNLVKSAISALVILVIAGGILAYYWVDEHRSAKV